MVDDPRTHTRLRGQGEVERLLEETGRELRVALAALQTEVDRRASSERLERARGEVLEMIAQRGTLETILRRLEAFCVHFETPVALQVVMEPASCPSGHGLYDEAGEIATGWPTALRLWARGRPGWLVPIRSGLGLLAIVSDGGRRLGPADRERAEIVATLAGLAMEHDVLLRTLDRQARFDSLTGLPNREEALRFLRKAILQSNANHTGLAVYMLDLDGFKSINDTLGHAAGDMLLVEVASRLGATLRSTDLVARLGGDEFLVVVPGLPDADVAARIATKILGAFAASFHVEGRELYVNASVGLALAPDHANDADVLQRQADAAMYVAKQAGRSRWESFSRSHQERVEQKLTLEQELRRAVEEGTFEVYYQAQVDAEGAIVGAEALLRWFHPTLGTISPGQFIPLAEELGVIVALGDWLLRRVCADMLAWRAAGLPDIRIAVNVSGVQFRRPDWHLEVARVVEEANLDPSLFQLELTESTLVDNPHQVAEMLANLRARGFKVALDDFGTGYAGLAYLQTLPLDVLKIDQMFVQGLVPRPGEPNSLPIVRAIVALARGLSLSVVAEGVELESQAVIVRELGCDSLQGFHFHRPISRERFRDLFTRDVWRRSTTYAPPERRA